MYQRLAYGIVLSCLTALLGCATPTAVHIQKVETTRQVEPTPGPATQTFKPDDPFVHAWVDLQEVQGEHVLRWDWLDPQGQLYMQSDPLQVGHTTKLYQQIRASHKMSLAKEAAAELPGKWTLQVFLDDRQVAEQEFWIEAPKTQRPTSAPAPATEKTPAIAPPLSPSPAFATERRIALVIGNGNYEVFGKLKNPLNDAADISAVLRELGFQVTSLQDTTLRDMKEAIKRFAQSLDYGGVGLLYYAGHGIQVDGRNYLIPIDARIEKDYEAEYTSVHASWILDAIGAAKNRVSIIVLDACRDNPITRSTRTGKGGLAAVQAARGSFIAYSTAPGRLARDGRGRNSPYARALLRHIKTPGVRVEQMFKKVRIAVEQSTAGQQTPWETSSLIGDFYFAPASKPAS